MKYVQQLNLNAVYHHAVKSLVTAGYTSNTYVHAVARLYHLCCKVYVTHGLEGTQIITGSTRHGVMDKLRAYEHAPSTKYKGLVNNKVAYGYFEAMSKAGLAGPCEAGGMLTFLTTSSCVVTLSEAEVNSRQYQAEKRKARELKAAGAVVASAKKAEPKALKFDGKAVAPDVRHDAAVQGLLGG